jgi:hypothetical protein
MILGAKSIRLYRANVEIDELTGSCSENGSTVM